MQRFPSALFLLLMTPLLWACGGGSGSSNSPQPIAACRALPPASAPDFLVHLTDFMNHHCYEKQHWTHDAQVRTSDGVHPFVRLWYSKQIVDWIKHNRQGDVPNGAMVVKEQFENATALLEGWTVMI